MKHNVTKTSRCPICGKPDMCFWDDRDMASAPFYICGRIDRDTVTGAGGRMFRKFSESRNGVNTYTTYLDMAEEEAFRKKWCEENGKTYRPRNGSALDISSVTTYSEEKWEYDSVIEPLPNELMGKILKEWLSCFVLSEHHKEKLNAEWGVRPDISRQIFSTWTIKSLPPEDDWLRSPFWKNFYNGPTRKTLVASLLKICLKHGLDSPKGIPGLYFEKGEWKINARSGILFPVYDKDDNIIRLRLGNDFPSVTGLLEGVDGEYRFFRDSWYFYRDGKPRDEKPVLAWRYGKGGVISFAPSDKKLLPDGKVSGKYVNVSSFQERRDFDRHVIVNQYHLGCRSGAHVSMYVPKEIKSSVVWITEGEKKSMVISAFYGAVVLCLPGVNTFSKLQSEGFLQKLREMGLSRIVVAFDADKESNDMVMKAQNGLVRLLLDEAFTVYITDWRKAFGKGLDDSLLAGIRPTINEVRRKMS